MKYKLAALLATSFLSITNSSLAHAASIRNIDRDIIPNQYIVVYKENNKIFKAGKSVEDLSAAIGKTHNGRIKKTFHKTIKAALFEMNRADAEKLANDPSVDFIEADTVIRISATQSYAPWGLDRIDQKPLPLSGTYTYPDNGGGGVHAYVIDSGIRTSHSEFYGRIGTGYSVINDGYGQNDCHGHGTHVAGIIGGQTWGVAKRVTLHPIRVFDCAGQGANSSLIQAIEWIAANRVFPAVANLSLAGGASSALDLAVDNLSNAGVLPVVAAGNSNADACSFSPARAAKALTVAAADRQDQRAGFSNYGNCVKVYAPGVDITSASISSDSGAALMSGTSMAAPHVTGVAAHYLQVRPAAPPSEVRAAISNNASENVVSYIPSGTNKYINTSFLMLTPRQITIRGGVSSDRFLLSTTPDGMLVDLYNKDDDSGRQQWYIELSPDNTSYNIILREGVTGDRKYLSTTQDGTKVDLWNTDDGSGRQRWVFSGENILVKDGVWSGRRYLSTTQDGKKVDLWTHDDGSGRQKWALTPVAP